MRVGKKNLKKKMDYMAKSMQTLHVHVRLLCISSQSCSSSLGAGNLINSYRLPLIVWRQTQR